MNEWWHDIKLEEALACRNTDYVIKNLDLSTSIAG